MGMVQYLNTANILRQYPKEEHAVFLVVEQRMQQGFHQDVGHAFLYTPQPGQWWPTMGEQRALRLAGHVAWMAPTPLVLDNVYVHPDRRGEGIGKKLVEQCLKYANQKGVPVVLRARPYRSRRMTVMQLCDWYHKLGFQYVGMHGDNHYMGWLPDR